MMPIAITEILDHQVAGSIPISKKQTIKVFKDLRAFLFLLGRFVINLLMLF